MIPDINFIVGLFEFQKITTVKSIAELRFERHIDVLMTYDQYVADLLAQPSDNGLLPVGNISDTFPTGRGNTHHG